MSRTALGVIFAIIFSIPTPGDAQNRSLGVVTESSELAASPAALAEAGAVVAETQASASAKTLESLQVAEGRAVLVADGNIDNFKYFEMTGPARLVLDIAGVVPGFGKKSFSAAAGFKAIRIGTQPNNTRVVLDASGPKLPSYAVWQRGQTIEVTWQAAAGSVAAVGAATAAGVLAKAATEPIASASDPTDLEQLRKYLEAESAKLAQQQVKFSEEESRYLASRQQLELSMAEQQRRIEEMRVKLGMPRSAENPPVASSMPEGNEATGTAAKVVTTTGVASEKPVRPVGRPPEKSMEPSYKEIEAIFERQGVLTPKGRFVLEPSLQYSYASSTRVALVGYTIIPAITIGLIDVRNVNRNTFVGALTSRYGLTNRLELELKVPYVYRNDSTTTQSINVDPPIQDVFDADGNDLGDIEFGFRYQFNMPEDDGPIFIGGIRVKSNTGQDPFEVPIDPATNLPLELATGSGFWGIQPNLTAIFPSDPAVFFGSVSYLYNINRTISGYGKIDPGDTIGFNFGVGYGINEKASFSLGYEHNVILKTKQDGDTLANSITTHVGSLLLGGSYRLNENTNLNLSLSGGLTEAAPDVQLTLRVPMTF